MVTAHQELQTLTKKEIRYVSIKFSEILERGLRLEASYYDEEGKRVRNIISHCKFEKLPMNGTIGFANVYKCGRFKRIFIEHGIPIYTASQILDSCPKPTKFISDKTITDLKSLILKENQILMTRSGIIGSVVLVSKSLSGKLFSDDLLRIECHKKEDVGFLYAFLKSSIGHTLITTNNYGSVITHIEPEHLEVINVPNIPQEIKNNISKKILSSFSLRDGANELFDEANELLLSSLELSEVKSLKPKYFSESDLKNYEVKYSKINLRFDASYHIPIINNIMCELKKSGAELVNLSDSRITKKIILPGRFKRIYVEENYGTPFLGGGEILEFNPSKLKFLSIKGHGSRIEKELIIRKNMILITCSGTIGKTVLAPEHFDGWSCSQHIIKIIPSGVTNVGYLYAFLASDYGYELIKRYSYGSVVSEIDDKHISYIPIPIISPKVMDKIGNLILEANEKRSEAFKLEKEAIKMCEECILSNQK